MYSVKNIENNRYVKSGPFQHPQIYLLPYVQYYQECKKDVFYQILTDTRLKQMPLKLC